MNKTYISTEASSSAGRGKVSLSLVTWVRASACTSVTPAVFYLSTGLAGCSVDPGISCGARKLDRTPRVTKKK